MGKQKREKRHLWHKTPYDGVAGAYAAVMRFYYQFAGPAQIGARNEAPYVMPTDPKCPVCKQSMKRHYFEGGGPGERTYMKCPAPIPEAARSLDGADGN